LEPFRWENACAAKGVDVLFLATTHEVFARVGAGKPCIGASSD